MPRDKDSLQLPGDLLKKADGALPPDNILDTWPIEPGGSEPLLPPGQDIPELTEVIPPPGAAAQEVPPALPAGFASAQEFLRAQALRVEAPRQEIPPPPALASAAFDALAQHLEGALQVALAQAMASALEAFAGQAEEIARRIAAETARTLAAEYQQALAAVAKGGNSPQNPL